VYFI
jgi:hypothetical protein